MIEEKIHKQERTTADHLAKPSNEITPDKISKPIASSSTPTKKKDKVYTAISRFRQNLNFSSQKSPTSFSLINLHTYLIGFPPSQSHGAEADCLALLRITAVLD